MLDALTQKTSDYFPKLSPSMQLMFTCALLALIATAAIVIGVVATKKRWPGIYLKMLQIFKKNHINQECDYLPIIYEEPKQFEVVDPLLGEILIADLRGRLRSWGHLCAQLLQMVYGAKQIHPEYFYCISHAQDALSAVGSKIAHCYDVDSVDLHRALNEIGDIRNEFGFAVQSYIDAQKEYAGQLKQAHATSDGAAKETLSSLKSLTL